MTEELVTSPPIILVIDDEPHNIRLCQRLLEREGFQVIAATSASQALAILSRQPVKILLADIHIPGLDAYQLINLARQYQPELATVIMTGFGTVETAIDALQHGVDGLILKPFGGANLVLTVQQALKEREYKQDIARLHALHPLLNITEVLFSETNSSRLNTLIVESVQRHLHCDYAALYQRTSKDGPFRLIAWKGDNVLSQSKELDKLLDAQLCQVETPLRISRSGRVASELQEVLDRYELNSLMCTPRPSMINGAVLLAARSAKEQVFREAEYEMLVLLARYGSIALENARLYSDLYSTIRQLEKSHRALSQAEKVAAAGRLAATVAHEINNPLQSINNCLHLAARKGASSAEQFKYLDIAQSELDRVMATVQRILDLYRPGARDRKISDVNALVNRVLILMESQLVEGRITVHTQLDLALPKITIMANQIQQVLLNLIINSVEAMPEGGEIFIETKMYDVNEEVGNKGGIEILIEDTGPGIHESVKETLFEPFVSTKENGTGLGLSVSYGIILAHGGFLNLLEGRGKGACFQIILPDGDTI